MQRCKYPTKTMNITQSYTGTYSHSKNYNGSPRDYPIDDNYLWSWCKGHEYHMDPVPGACADAQLYGLCDDHGDPSQ